MKEMMIEARWMLGQIANCGGRADLPSRFAQRRHDGQLMRTE